jgi:diguanylate cyclase (GGDEF)-like protein
VRHPGSRGRRRALHDARPMDRLLLWPARGDGDPHLCRVGHAIALLVLPSSSVYPGRWIDVMVSVSGTAVVVLALEGRNQSLLGRVVAEARTDPLTGLLNRRGLEERAEVEIARTRRDGTPMAVASFDPDHFKHINDEWGHDTGDRVLAWIRRLLTAEARDINTVARVGGEEFVVLLPDADLARAGEFTERVRAALDRHDTQGLSPLAVGAGVVWGARLRISRRCSSAPTPRSTQPSARGAIGRCPGRRRRGRARHRPTTGSPPRRDRSGRPAGFRRRPRRASGTSAPSWRRP